MYAIYIFLYKRQQRIVKKQQVADYAKQYNWSFFEASAKVCIVMYVWHN